MASTSGKLWAKRPQNPVQLSTPERSKIGATLVRSWSKASRSTSRASSYWRLVWNHDTASMAVRAIATRSARGVSSWPSRVVPYTYGGSSISTLR